MCILKKWIKLLEPDMEWCWVHYSTKYAKRTKWKRIHYSTIYKCNDRFNWKVKMDMKCDLWFEQRHDESRILFTVNICCMVVLKCGCMTSFGVYQIKLKNHFQWINSHSNVTISTWEFHRHSTENNGNRWLFFYHLFK